MEADLLLLPDPDAPRVANFDDMGKTVETRKKLKEVASISSFDFLLDQSTLSDLDKEILRLHYLKEKDFRYIGDMLGYAEVTIKKRHIKALAKIQSLF